MANNFEIIDATLRDGSNAINFQFSIDDTVNIVKGLEHSGIKWIEVGHGLGLGASERTSKKALQTDEEYITAAKKSVNQAKVGCFFLQDIGTKDGLIPKGWKMFIASEYCESIADGTHDTPKPSLNGVPLFTSKNLTPNNKLDKTEYY
ncbi:MAG: hypothetical protein VB106_19700, partial [Clostridiaceae bacterium]|nr:hypothetical protein [Clostridiaceae bacterium]